LIAARQSARREPRRGVVGTNGTVCALSIEPEPSDTSSATVLAIAPDSTVLYANDDRRPVIARRTTMRS
jgi:hypothetical protein